METPSFLFRGEILVNIKESQGVTTGENVLRKTLTKSTTHNFKKYSVELDTEDQKEVQKISDETQYIQVLNKLKRKHN